MKIKNGAVMALIPARAGSKGIKDKNIVDVGGFPLVAYSIAAAKLCQGIYRIIVSTDSENYAKIGEDFGAEVPFLRPDYLSQNQSLDIEYIRYTLEELFRLGNDIPELILLLRPTTPLRNPQHLADIIKLAYAKPESSSIVSVSKSDSCPYKWLKKMENGYLSGPFSELAPDDVNLPRQSFPQLLIPDGYADVIKSRVVLEQGCVYGDKAIPWYSPDGVIDIDTKNELNILRKSDFMESDIYKFLLKQNH